MHTKVRNPRGKICVYRLVDANGNREDIPARDLKRLMDRKDIDVINLTLTRDNRLASTNRSNKHVEVFGHTSTSESTTKFRNEDTDEYIKTVELQEKNASKYIKAAEFGSRISNSYYNYLDECIFGAMKVDDATTGWLVTTRDIKFNKKLKGYKYMAMKGINKIGSPALVVMILSKDFDEGLVEIDYNIGRMGYAENSVPVVCDCIQSRGHQIVATSRSSIEKNLDIMQNR